MATTTKATSKTLTTASMPPSIEAMRIALAYVALNNIDAGVALLKLKSTDMLRRWAVLGKELSDRGQCFFCEKKRPKIGKKAKTDWENYQLCPCLAVYKVGYEELYPWRNLRRLIRDVDAGKVDASTPAFADNCTDKDCKRGHPRFTVPVGVIVYAAKKNPENPTYHKTWRCDDCRHRAKMRKREAVAAAPLTHNVVVKSNKNKNKKQQKSGLAALAGIKLQPTTPNEMPQG